MTSPDRPIAAFSSYSPAAASTRVRLYDWFDHLGLSIDRHCHAGLRNAAPTTLARNLPKVVAAEVNLRRFDASGRTVMMSREASPLSRGHLEQRILAGAANSVYDFDDAIYLTTSLARRPLDPQQKFARCVEAAQVVIAGNDHLAEVAARYAERVVMIPSCVEPDHYSPRTHWELAERPTLVWLGSGATEQYLEPLLSALDRLHSDLGIRLKVISTGHPNQRLSGRDWVQFVQWRPETFAAELTKGDIALAPLTDTPFARGKCAYKLLQYAASALPMVGSPVGANRLALDRFQGLAVTQPSDWYEGVRAMVETTAADRATRARGGLVAVRRWYSFAAWAPEWRRTIGMSPE